MVILHIEHICPRKHGGSDDESNLCLACIYCNLHKGSNLTGVDPSSGAITELFHPRRQKWSTHFEWNKSILVGKTAIGRTTIRVLNINLEEQVRLRSILGRDQDMH